MLMLKIKMGNRYIVIYSEIIVPLIMLGFAVIFYMQCKDLSYSALLFPRILFLGVLVFSLLRIYVNVEFLPISLIKKKTTRITQVTQEPLTKKLVIFTIAFACTLLLLKVLGTLISITLFLLFSLQIGGVRNLLLKIAISFMLPVIIYFLFQHWLKVPLPAGLIFRFI